ncbi:hypothetical protein [Acholeplasma hippikon]|uniref:Uncharacterized protein n=1 Tax=Acholeplasma hippikon TaxID=264636 RepID=A0A449BJZ3_9MOLU|nr:hypothetical protein [Acholeplasma hippikon]VEU82772.1 Uncharacterised protein [Acholeplasma hippikon]
MQKLKSAKFWVANLIISFGISLVMSIAAPLIQGYSLVLKNVLLFSLYNGLVSATIGAFIPLREFSILIIRIFTKEKNDFVIGLVFNFILTAILSFTASVYANSLTYEHFIITLKVFPWLVFVAYTAEFFFVRLATKVINLW